MCKVSEAKAILENKSGEAYLDLVIKIKYRVVKGELCRFYELSRENGCLSVPLKNKNIFGMSIPAMVKERSGNCIHAHFHIDKTYDNSPNTKYFTYAIESSAVYCMPELESQVHIYFPSDEEKDAIAVHALRTSGGGKGGGKAGGSGGGGGYAQNPDSKSFSNVNGAELLMAPVGICASADQAQTASVILDAKGNATIKGTEIEIKADENLSIGTPAGEGGAAVLNLYLEGSKITAQIGEGETTKIELTEQAHIISTFVKLNTSDTTPVNPSVEEITSVVTAGDAAVIENMNAGLAGDIVEKYEEGRAKILSGAALALATVGSVALAVVITIGTAGAGAPLAGALMLGTYGLAGTTLTFAAADITEGMGDVEKSRNADFSQSFNFLRDTVFMGNQDAYNIAKMINNIAFGIVSGKAIGAGINTIMRASEAGAVLCASKEFAALKSVISIGRNVASGAINDYIYTGKVDIKNLAINTGLGLLQGQAGSRISAGILGDLAGNKDAMAATSTFVDTGLDWLVSEMTGKDFKLLESLASNAASNFLASNIADPVDAVTGEYIIHATDFILASLPVALKLERTYRSGSRERSAMGRGWSFSYGSCMYRDTSKDGRIHMNTLTGHTLLFEWEDGVWVNKTLGTQRFTLEMDAEQHLFTLLDVIDHTVCRYNGAGRLVQVEYPNRQRILLAYGEDGLSKITTPLDHVLDVVSREGRILQITDELGRRIQYRYEGDYLTDIVHADEGITHYEYDDQGFIMSVTDENGSHYLNNRYDDKGRILQQTFENGVRQDFYYDDSKRRNTITFGESGKREIYEYNRDLLTTQIIYEDGTTTAYEYSEQNLRTAQVDRNGARTVWEYDQHGRMVRESRPDGYQVSYEYDENHDLTRTWDTDQRETINQYDNHHNLLCAQERITDRAWKETTYQYDEKGRRTSMEDGVGNTTSYQYDPAGAHPRRILTPKGEETVYEYDKVGRRMSIGTAYGTAQMAYNSRNFVTKRTDGEGYVSRWFYDRMGNLTSYIPARQVKNEEQGYQYRYDFLERLTDTISPLGEHQRIFHNIDGDITKEIHPVSYQSKKEDGEGTCYEYDSNQDCIRICYPDGGVERRFYDPEGNMIKQVMPESYDKQTDDGAGYTYIYDTQGRMLEIYDPENNRLHSYRYNGHGQILQEVDGEGKETLYRYNGLGQVERVQISVKKEDERVSYRVISYRYDRQGNKVEEAYGQEETAKDGEPQSWHRISFSYDKNNHLTRVQDEFGARMQYDYDCLGNLILEEQTIEEGIRRRIRYTYNKNGWRIKKEEEIQGNGPVRFAITQYEYDENGNLVRTLTPGGHETRCSYDANDRPVTERILDKRNGIDYQLHYTYDAAGNLLQKRVEGKQGESLKTSYRYDLKNRKTHEIGQSQGVTRYLYNWNDQLIKEIHPSGYEPETDEGAGTTYRYDSRGNRTKTVNGLNQLVETNSYNLQNHPILRQDGLRNQTEIGYTLDGQMKEILRGTSQKHPIQQYTYNARGQITGITDGVGETVEYGLDGWGRITSIYFSDGVKEGYEYTPSGKVSKVTGGNGHSVQYLYNSLGKVRERIDQLGESETFQYDEEGNLMLHVDRDGNQTHRTYNVLGDVVYEKAVDKNGENPCITTYQYDSLGRLSKGICNGHSYEYTYRQNAYIKPQTYEKWKKRSFKRDISKRENMGYDEESDCYTCRMGKKLRREYIKKQKSKSGYESEITVYECVAVKDVAARKHVRKLRETNVCMCQKNLSGNGRNPTRTSRASRESYTG